jgi:DNA primase
MIDPVEQIKERLSIVDVVSSYISLTPAGKNHKANCPFHNEKTPSFHVSPDRGSYYCFGCGVKGDIFTFVQEFEGLDFRGALSVLSERAGVKLTKWTGEKKQKLDHLYEIMERATRFFEDEYSKSATAKEYAAGRGLTENTQKDFRIGFAPDDWRKLFDHLTQAGFEKKDLLLVGLIKEGNGSTYDRFRNRVMFPIFDTSGRPIAFSGRTLSEDDKTAKYLNSPETPLFQKGDVLYGLHVAKNTIRKVDFSVLVEGQLDLLLSHQAGFPNTVAASGTALTEKTSKEGSLNHFGIIKRLSNNVVLAFDSDAAGLKAMYRAAKICLSLGMEAKTAVLPEGKDPADIIAQDGKDAWKEILKNAEHCIIFLTKYIKERESDTRLVAKRLQEKILPLVALLESTMEQMSFVRDISVITGIPEDGIQADLKRISAGLTIAESKQETAKKAHIRTPDKEAQIKKMTVGMHALLKEKGSLPELEISEDVQKALDSFDEKDKNALMFEIEEVYKDDEKKLQEDFELYVKELKQLQLKNKLAELEEQIRQGAGDDTLKQYQDILKNINNN